LFTNACLQNIQWSEALMAVCVCVCVCVWFSGLWCCIVSYMFTSNYVLSDQHCRRHSMVQTFREGRMCSIILLLTVGTEGCLALCKKKAVPLHTMEALWGWRGIAPTHSWSQH
jgi:hypothetical protein